MGGAATIQVREASKWYGAVIGVNEISLDFTPGITGLLGPNGAGKSTLMKLITGQLRPSLGDVRVNDRSVWRSFQVRRQIGYAPDLDSFHEEMSGFRFVYTMARLSGLGHGRARSGTREALEMVGMTAAADKRLRECSRGMRQRIKLAQALVHDPPVLILDEPLNGVDPHGRIELKRFFRGLEARGKTVLISSHILEEVEAVTDRIVLMKHGRILVSGTVGRIRDLMDDHPLTIRIATDRGRRLATELVASENVVGISVNRLTPARDLPAEGDAAELILKVRRPEQFFRDLPALISGLELEITALEPLDASAAAIFDYLVGGRAPEGT